MLTEKEGKKVARKFYLVTLKPSASNGPGEPTESVSETCALVLLCGVERAWENVAKKRDSINKATPRVTNKSTLLISS